MSCSKILIINKLLLHIWRKGKNQIQIWRKDKNQLRMGKLLLHRTISGRKHSSHCLLYGICKTPL